MKLLSLPLAALAFLALSAVTTQTGYSWPPPYIGHLLDEDITVGDGPGQYEPPPEIQQPTDPDYWVDHIDEYIDNGYEYSYSSGSYSSYENYTEGYFYFEETGEFIYVYTYEYEYTYGGVTTSYYEEYTEDYSKIYGSTYYDTYVKTNSYYQSMLYTVDSNLLDQITDALNKLKPVI